MAKKNFDDFINAAGKKPKPTPEEVEAMAKQLHEAASPVANVPTTPATALAPPIVEKPKATVKPIAKQKPTPTAARQPSTFKRQTSTEPPKEKVRITIDLAKDLYKRMKLAVVQNETEISAYVRQLIENDLEKK